MNREYSREEIENLPHDELKRIAAELEYEGAQIKKKRHYFIEEFWRRIENGPLKAAELGEGGLAALQMGGKPIVFAKVEDKVYAFSDRCPHKGFPLHKGRLEGHTLTCAYHGGQFEVRNGQCLKHPYATYPCQSFSVHVAADGKIECKG